MTPDERHASHHNHWHLNVRPEHRYAFHTLGTALASLLAVAVALAGLLALVSLGASLIALYGHLWPFA